MSPTWFEPGEDGQPVPAPYPGALAPIEVEVQGLRAELGALTMRLRALERIIVAGFTRTPPETIEFEGADGLDEILARADRLAERLLERVEGQATVRLGPAFVPKVTRDPGFRVAGPDGEVRPARHDFTERELVAMDREALREAAADLPGISIPEAIRVMGYDGSETVIPIDRRVVYGARCSWWETIDKADQLPSPRGDGLPCCPHCRSVLYEVPSEAVWLGPALDQYEAAGRPGYRAMIEWGRGKCFRAERPGEHPMDALRRAYEAETGTELTWTAL